MNEINDRQVGGDHYKTGGLQHWDLIDQYEIPYLEGCATKYLWRWEKKGGLVDLLKALHYLEKARQRKNWPKRKKPKVSDLQLFGAGEMNPDILRICELVLCSGEREDIRQSISTLKNFLSKEEEVLAQNHLGLPTDGPPGKALPGGRKSFL